MASENSPPTSPNPSRRRASFSPGQAFSGLFSRPSNAGQHAPTNAFPGPIATAAANAQQRRSMSITTLGLSTSPTQPTWAKGVNRRSSISSSGSGSPGIDEEAIDDSEGPGPQNTPSTPFGRRLSFGAQALRDVRAGSVGNNGRRSVSSSMPTSASTSSPVDTPTTATTSSPARGSLSMSNPISPVKGSNLGTIGEGLNWGEQLRARARAPSFGSASASASAHPPTNNHDQPLPKTQQVPGVEVKEPSPRQPMKPDHVGERMLRGDFYMD